MPKYVHFSNTGPGRNVLADASNVQRKLRNVQQLNGVRSLKGVQVLTNGLSLSEPFIIPDECATGCDKKVVNIAARLELSGPIESASQKLALLEEVYQIAKSEIFAREMKGFPINPSVEYTTTTTGA